MKKIDWKTLILCLFIPVVLVGGGSALCTMNSMEVYKNMEKPSIAPPGWLFPVVWTILFILMGIASYLVWESGSSRRGTALTVYGLQLAVNFLWTLVFFNLQAYWASVAVLVVLWVLILAAIVLFARINRTSAWLLVPYLIWVTFAAYLNISVAILN